MPKPINLLYPKQNPPDRLPAWLEIILLLSLSLALLLPRVGGLGSFVTADEPTWGKRAANFYYALRHSNYADTYQTGHPGVITMWAGALGFHLQFPDYERVGQDNLGDTKLFDIFQNHQVNPMKILATARLAIVLVVCLTLLVAWLFARQLFDTLTCAIGFFLIALEPMHVAHSRFLHTNGLSSSSMFLCVLAFLHFLRTRRKPSLVVSGIAAGLGFLTVTPSLMVIPIIAFLGLRELFVAPRAKLFSAEAARMTYIPLIAWGLISLLVVFIVWPAMWVDPVGTVSNVFNHALNAAEGGGGGAELVSAYQVDYDPSDKYIYYYPLTYLWRSTPVTWLGLIILGGILATRSYQLFNSQTRQNLAGLAWFILLFTVLMTLGTKKFDRYLLPCYLALDIMAAAGFTAGFFWVQAKLGGRLKTLLPATLIGLALAVHALLTANNYPYYLTYFNPLLGGIEKASDVLLVGWGEGLNEAAIYLKERPNIRDKEIIAWYPLAFNWYSHSLGFKTGPIEIERTTSPERLQKYLAADYAVIYLNQWQRSMPAELFAILDQLEPEKTIQIKGIDYVRIYHLENSHP